MRLIGLLIVIALSAGAGLLVLNLTSKEKEQEVKIVEVPTPVVQEVPTVDVLVARSEIPIGTALTAEMLDRQPWPQHLKLDDFIVSDGKGDAAIMGMVSRSSFAAGEPLNRSKLANPKDPSFLAAALPAGMRAVTVTVDVTSSAAGFIFPGDRVDVLIQHEVSTGSPSGAAANAPDKTQPLTEVLVPNVKVIAVDQSASIQGGQVPRVPGSVTLEVSRRDAQRINLAGSQGRLALSLRSLQDKDDETLPPPSALTDLSRITPPSYFPVLYNGDDYATVMVDVFGQGQGKADDGKKAEKEAATMRDNIRKGLASNAQATSVDMVGLAGSGAGFSTDVTVVRGSQAEVIGVNRP